MIVSCENMYVDGLDAYIYHWPKDAPVTEAALDFLFPFRHTDHDDDILVHEYVECYCNERCGGKCIRLSYSSQVDDDAWRYLLGLFCDTRTFNVFNFRNVMSDDMMRDSFIQPVKTPLGKVEFSLFDYDMLSRPLHKLYAQGMYVYVRSEFVTSYSLMTVDFQVTSGFVALQSLIIILIGMIWCPKY